MSHSCLCTLVSTYYCIVAESLLLRNRSAAESSDTEGKKDGDKTPMAGQFMEFPESGKLHHEGGCSCQNSRGILQMGENRGAKEKRYP